MTPDSAALVVLMDQYRRGLLDPFITSLEVQKLAYFLQEAGEGLGLDFKKSHDGPYAEKLRSFLSTNEGNFISRNSNSGDAPAQSIEIISGALENAEQILNEEEDTSSRVDQVADLIDGFETNFGLELLSTVHWTIEYEKPRSLDELATLAYRWNEGKKHFSRRRIELAADKLFEKGWTSLIESVAG